MKRSRSQRNEVRVTIGVTGRLQALSAGNLVRTWTENDRTFYRYRTS